ncbi:MULTISPECIES: copper resistance system multicopper oxidase [unclassified Colwellia]|nr:MULTISPECIES: copper resistance system multicopper oxidase [unclassified Colwellia]MBA6353720.1 copper resistance system multicopper oxidase [Colwellia sp. BRX9-1]MBA6357505.1 copper resistance system multicopper oxidase [Colwellia sp. BRX8-3]MBA6361688.1 copper resistance system multicopper oxidase [Colwellia sp. BRX8-6]MBA6369390.1 copper resistance system multicopper oxidase [Colwellia sp. BRX8-5]MBA6372747.1 copper resistance system multicopper oxidase [Colwellia sp. BRX8-4]
MTSSTKNTHSIINRRQFVRGLALTSVAAAVASNIPSTFASNEFISQGSTKFNPKQPMLTGTEFDLTISETTVNITGTPALATLVNGSLPAPTLVWHEGDEITLRVTNKLMVDSSIHWHGIILPTNMDGVPGLSYDGIKPGETYVYQFTVKQNGTYWYHSHSAYQEQTGVIGAIVILPKKQEPIHSDHDYVIQLSDWSDTPPETIYANLKKMGDYYNFHQRTVGDFWSELKQKGFSQAWKDRSMWNNMKMSDRDLSDVTGATYTYLMNGLSPNAHWRTVVESGKKVRLRFINSSSMTFFDVQIPGLKMTVVAADGNLIQPVEVDEFRIGVAETYDVIVEPDTDKQAYAIFAQAIDRSGYAIGSITSNASKLASVPAMDPLPILSMTDMGMEMDGMDQSGQDMLTGMQMNGKNQNDNDMSGGMQMNGKDQSDNDMSGGMQMGQDVSNAYYSKNAQTMSNMNVNLDDEQIPMDMNPKLPLIDVPEKEGPQIAMRATGAKYRLDDPGVGLRNNGRKVLTYADLKNLYPTRHEPKPTKQLLLHLTGNMERYMWSINGIPYGEAQPLKFNFGERIRVTFINDTMMNHPMHLHGVWSDLETGDENHIPRKHTIVVQPGSKISYRVTMNARGDWAYHCHMLYHMMGMFRRVQIR